MSSASASSSSSSSTASLIPAVDAAWRPAVPVGHTDYTWGKLGHPPEGRLGGTTPNNKQKKGEKKSKNKNATPTTASSSEPKPAPVAAAVASGPPLVIGPASSSSSSSSTAAPSPKLPVSDRRNILITSALPYVNNVPHLGNVIGSVLSADVYARFCRLRGHNAIYVCGTDEYGTATETKALEEGLTPQAICDKYHAIHKRIYEWFDISFDKFGRTTTPQQTEIAQQIFLELEKNGWSSEAEVEQLYCEKCQRFLADRFVEGTCPDPACAYDDARGDQCDKCGKLVNATELVNPKCKLCKSSPVVRLSKHLFLDLQKLQPELAAWFEKQSVKGEWSDNAINITEAWLKLGLKPRCITRDLKWGTPVPKLGFEDKVFYVWFDAPIGYISITACYTPEWKQWWKNPENVELVQFMGKDNVPFHCVIFPSTLMAADKNNTLLHHVSCTEYLQYEGSKFSKSRGTGVFGDDAVSTGIPSEVWRYYMLYNRPETSDTVFLWEDFAAKNNSELLANLGNFVNRTLAFIHSKCGNVVPPFKLLPSDEQFIGEISALKGEYIDLLEHVKLKDALKTAMAISKKSNQFMQDNQPWSLFKTDRERCNTILYLSVNLISTLAVLLEPYMPSLTQKINAQLHQQLAPEGVLDARDPETRKFQLLLQPGHVLGTPAPLFRKIEDSEIAALRVRFGGAPAAKKKGEPFPLNLILATVTEARDHEAAPHLFVLTLRTDESEEVATKSKLVCVGHRQVVAGLRPHYEAKDLVGKTLALLVNIKPSNFKGVRSEGMLLTAVKGKSLGLLTVDAANVSKVQVGATCMAEDCSPAYKANFDVKNELKKLDLVTRGESGVVCFGSAQLVVQGKDGSQAPVVGEGVGEGAKIQ